MVWMSSKDFYGVAPFQQLNLDYANANSKIDVLEVRFSEDDSALHCWVAFSAITDLAKAADFKSGSLTYIRLNKTNYKVWDNEAKANKEIEPLPLEGLMIQAIKSIEGWNEGAFSGVLNFTSNEAVLKMLSDGMATPQQLGMVALMPLKGEQKYLPAELPKPKGASYGGGAKKFKTEGEKAAERLTYYTSIVQPDSEFRRQYCLILGLDEALAGTIDNGILVEFARDYLLK